MMIGSGVGESQLNMMNGIGPIPDFYPQPI